MQKELDIGEAEEFGEESTLYLGMSQTCSEGKDEKRPKVITTAENEDGIGIAFDESDQERYLEELEPVTIPEHKSEDELVDA